MEEVLPNSRAAMPQKLRECISEWEWAVCTFLVLISQSTQRCRSQNFASLSLEIPLQRRQGRPELSHLLHQAISTPPSPSGTTFQPFLAYSSMWCRSTVREFASLRRANCHIHPRGPLMPAPTPTYRELDRTCPTSTSRYDLPKQF